MTEYPIAGSSVEIKGYFNLQVQGQVYVQTIIFLQSARASIILCLFCFSAQFCWRRWAQNYDETSPEPTHFT